MDLALERIERDTADNASESDAHSTTLSAKENFEPLAAPAHASRELSAYSPIAPSNSGRQSSRGFGDTSGAAAAGSSRALAERLEALDSSWRESHAALSAECAQLIQEVAALRGSDDERAKRANQSLTDFEVELTTALEARAKETDGLLERRLMEAGDGLMRRLAEFESAIREESARSSGVEGDVLKRIEQVEATLGVDQARASEAPMAMQEAMGFIESARGQLTEVGQQIRELQRESGATHGQLCDMLQQMQRLQQNEGEVQRQLASMSRQMQQPHPCQARVDTASSPLPLAEAERRFQMLDDAFSSRLRETENSVVAQHSVLKAQVHELKCCIEVVQHRLQAEITDLRHVSAAPQQLQRRRPPLPNSKGSAARTSPACPAGGTSPEALGEEDVEADFGWAETLDTLASHQQKQQTLIEELLAAAALRADAAGRDHDYTEFTEHIAVQIEDLVARVRCLEEASFSQYPTGQAAAAASAPDGSVGREGCQAARLGVHTTKVLPELIQQCVGRLDDITARLLLVEERTAATTRPVTEVQEAVATLRADLRAVEHAGVVQAAHLEALAARTSDSEPEKRDLLEQLAAQQAASSSTQRAAASAEKAAAEAVAEARDARRAAEKCEMARGASGTTPRTNYYAVGASAASSGSACTIDKEGKEAVACLEARMELSEAKQRMAVQEIQHRIDKLYAMFTDPNFQLGGVEPPWAVRLRELEHEVRDMFAAQVEDSANTLRSMAMLVEEQVSQSLCASTVYSQSCMPPRLR